MIRRRSMTVGLDPGVDLRELSIDHPLRDVRGQLEFPVHHADHRASRFDLFSPWLAPKTRRRAQVRDITKLEKCEEGDLNP